MPVFFYVIHNVYVLAHSTFASLLNEKDIYTQHEALSDVWSLALLLTVYMISTIWKSW